MPSSLLSITEGLPYPLTPDEEPPLAQPGPLVAERWLHYLHYHPDKLFKRTLAGIIMCGAKIGYSGPSHRLILNKSHPSALQAPEILLRDLEKQRLHDRITQVIGQPIAPFISSPLGLVPKHDGGWRRIHDLSFPPGASVNDGIQKEHGALEYATFDDAMAAVLHQGRGAQMAKKDL